MYRTFPEEKDNMSQIVADKHQIDHFTDTAAILSSVFLKWILWAAQRANAYTLWSTNLKLIFNPLFKIIITLTQRKLIYKRNNMA